MPITTGRGFLRSILSSALTEAATTTSALTAGIAFTEGTIIEASTTPKGCWTLSSESREPDDEFSEDLRDRSGEAEATVRVTKKLEPGENLYDIADALVDAVERAIDAFAPADDDQWEHPVTGVVWQIDAEIPMEIGLITPANQPGDATANVVLYPVIRFHRLHP
jgi:hypothetical protein